MNAQFQIVPGLAPTSTIFEIPVIPIRNPFSALSSGAALIAASADGHEMNALQKLFCRTIPESAIQPDLSLQPVYEAALLSQTIA